MLFSIVLNYFAAILIDKYLDNKNKVKLFLVLDISINLLLLIIFKYTNLIISTINGIFKISIDKLTIFNIDILKLTLPIGISFYTFQLISYVIDVYRKDVKVQKNIFSLGTYIAFFPQLIAGPIVRYETIEKELKHRTHSFEKFVCGFKRFIIGLGKKVIIANNVAFIADQIIDSQYFTSYGTGVIWIAMIAYSLQIYFDFSGYSDMAIGLGKIFGFTFLENFNYPYIAKSITDFWRRWHISLSSWFRDYVYIPLGGNRVKKGRWIINLFIVWTLTGLWHGASWNFMFWGLYYGIILVIEKLFLNKLLEKSPSFIKWLYSIILIIIGWTIFRIEDISLLGETLHKMFVFQKTDWLQFIRLNYHLISYFVYFILGLLLIFPLVGNIMTKIEKKSKLGHNINNLFVLIVFILSILFLIKATYNPFIYFRF